MKQRMSIFKCICTSWTKWSYPPSNGNQIHTGMNGNLIKWHWIECESNEPRSFLWLSHWTFNPSRMQPYFLHMSMIFKTFEFSRSFVFCFFCCKFVFVCCFHDKFLSSILWNANFNFFPLTYLFINLKHLDLFLLFCPFKKIEQPRQIFSLQSLWHMSFTVNHIACDQMHTFACCRDVIGVDLNS